jgi:iron complex transport system substrate-binding protein
VQLRPAVARVVSLAPSSTEILFAVGAGAKLVGRDRYSDWPPEAARVETVGADIDPSLERIVGLRPDLVLTSTSANTQATADALERAGVPVYVSRSESLEAIYQDVQAIGDAVGRGDEARALAARMRARLEALRRRVAGRPVERAAVVVWTEPLVLAGRHSHVGDILGAVGGDNVVEGSPQPFPTFSLERLLARAPEVVVVGSHKDNAPPLTPLERLSTLPAVQHHRLLTIDGDLLFRPGPRVVDGAEALARMIHPEVAAP